MKTKLLIGLAATGAASLFWACGSGDIVKIQSEDTNVRYLYAADDETGKAALSGMVNQAVKDYCDAQQAGEDCIKALAPGQGAAEDTPKSSSSATYTPITTAASNSQSSYSSGSQPGDTPHIINPTSNGTSGGTSSSPSNPFNPASSSGNSTPVVTPGTTTVTGNEWATCVSGAANNTAKKGSTVTWQVTPNASIGGLSDRMGATYLWTLNGATPATGEKSSVSVSYPNSGTYTTSVVVTRPSDLSSQVIPCPSIEITGAEVTGCMCTPTVAQADVATAPAVGWNVTGCVSAEQTFTYAWGNGYESFTGASIAATATQAGTFAPTVRVKNADNGLMDVTCGAIKVIDSNHPEFYINAKDKKIGVPKGESTIILDLPVNWSPQPTCVLRCDGADAPITVTMGTTSSEPSYSTTLPLNVSQTTGRSAVVINVSFQSAKDSAYCQVGY